MGSFADRTAYEYDATALCLPSFEGFVRPRMEPQTLLLPLPLILPSAAWDTNVNSAYTNGIRSLKFMHGFEVKKSYRENDLFFFPHRF